MIFIVGATASGKTALSIALAKRLNGEIVSADSMQIYRHMDIGTAKVSEKEKEGVKHHLIDILEPNENFSVAEYQNIARKKILEIKSQKKVPIIVGGTGLYVNSLIYDYGPALYDEELRNELKNEYLEHGADFLYNKLQEIDTKACEKIHKNNVKRVIRALEVKILTGESLVDKTDKNKVYPHLMYAVEHDRDILYDRINVRVDNMFSSGLIDEVNSLINKRNVTFESQSMQAIGYKEFKDYLEGKINEDELRVLIKQHSRNYAKRQITWFKSIPTCVWLKNTDIITNCQKIEQDYYKNIDKML